MKRSISILLGLIAIGLTTACSSVKPYERAYLSDEEMKLDMKKCAHHEAYFQVIREGASGANGGKTGGGCGCN